MNSKLALIFQLGLQMERQTTFFYSYPFDQMGKSFGLLSVMYVRTIDTLKPLEQLILKVGSALGYNFKRDALKYVIAQDMTVIEKSFGRGMIFAAGTKEKMFTVSFSANPLFFLISHKKFVRDQNTWLR